MVIVVFIDANILHGHPWLEGRVWQDLLRDRRGLDVRVVLSEVVVLENVGMVERASGKALGDLKKGRLFDSDFYKRAEDQLRTYDERFRERVRNLGVDVLEASREHLVGGVKRAAQQIAPALAPLIHGA